MDAHTTDWRTPDGEALTPTMRRAGLKVPYALTGLAIVAIWVSVVLATIFSPDMVTGSQHEHLASGWLDWMWGAIATGLVVTAALDGIRARVTTLAPWLGLGLAVTAIWAGVLLVSVLTPRFVTGTDPTMIPFGAWFAPIAGLILTTFVCTFVKSIFAFEKPVGQAPRVDGDDTVAKLRQLRVLRDSGTITPAEFEAKKADLLSRL